MKLSDVANTCFLPFHTVIIFLLCLMSGLRAPTWIAPSWPLWSLVPGFIFWMLSWVGEINAWLRKCLRAPLLYPFVVVSHWDDVVGWLSEGTQRALLVKHLEGHRWWACYTQSRRHLAEGWHHRCATHCDMEKCCLCSAKKIYCLCLWDAKIRQVSNTMSSCKMLKQKNTNKLLMKHPISDLIF